MEFKLAKFCVKFALLLIILFTLLYFLLPKVIEMIVRSQINVLKESRLHQKWLISPLPINYSFYFFNILNPKAAINGSRIKLKEVGPFCLRQYRRKRILGWSDDNKLVRYLEFRRYQWSQDTKCLKPNTKLTLVNAPIVSLITIVVDLIDKIPFKSVSHPIAYGIINDMIQAHRQNLFMTRTAKEVIFGFKVNLFEKIKKFAEPLINLGFKNILPLELMVDNKFGILYGKNDTPEGPYEIYTGIGDTSKKFNYIHKWQEQKLLKWWAATECNEIKGGDGSFFPPLLQPYKPLWSFIPATCRSLKLAFVNFTKYKGVSTYQYSLDINVLRSSLSYEPNACYCPYEKKRHRCRYDGLMDATLCNSGAPLILSYPHFLYTNPYAGQAFDGLSPNHFKHRIFLEVEPVTGFLLNTRVRLQFSFRVENFNSIKGFDRIKEVIIPLLWIEQGLSLDDNNVNEVKQHLNLLNYFKLGVKVTTAISWIAFIITLVYFFTTRKQKNDKITDLSLSEASGQESPHLPIQIYTLQNRDQLFRSLNQRDSFVLHPGRLFINNDQSKSTELKQVANRDTSAMID